MATRTANELSAEWAARLSVAEYQGLCSILYVVSVISKRFGCMDRYGFPEVLELADRLFSKDGKILQRD